MLSNVISIVCLGIWILAAYATFLTPSGSGWRHGLDMLALILLIVVMVLTTGAGQRLEVRKWGPRRLRMALYWTVLITSIAADFEWFPRSDGVRCHSSVTLFLAAMVVSPLLAAEARDAEVEM